MAYSNHFTKTPLLIFGLSGQIGSGVSFVRDKLTQALASYEYKIVVIDVSRVILEELFNKLSINKDDLNQLKDIKTFKKSSDLVQRIFTLQKSGNILRKEYGNDAIASISLSQVIFQKLSEIDEDIEKALKTRIAFVIDSLKHPHEIFFLREIFRSAFYSIGVVANDSIRKDRLINRKGFTEDDFKDLSALDANEDEDYGQKAVKTIVESDYFISNDFSNRYSLTSDTQRLLRLIFSIGVETPHRDEVGMNIATQSALRSGCISRQVGAAIIDPDGEILATGRNDVPKYGGGLYTSETKEDHRCWTFAARCYNDKEKQGIISELNDSIIQNLSECNLSPEIKIQIRKVLEHSRIKSLIEFSRAVHAEMDAIVSVARNGRAGLRGSTLYCTTYPCHNCAKHIIDAGITRVVYLEPYEKSLARKLHPDTICDPLRGRESDKVPFEGYHGVAPRRFEQFFKSTEKRKDDSSGQFIDRDKEIRNLFPDFSQDDITLAARIKKIVAEHSAKNKTDL